MKGYQYFVVIASITAFALADCPDYSTYSTEYHPPFSSGIYNLSYMRPDPECRTFYLQEVEDTITNMSSVIADPDLYRLFLNSYPNILDTAVKFKGYANDSDEELTFLITGDINAMWLRDSANQVQSYLSLLKANDSAESLASLYRGVINLQARYINIAPHCNSFQPPVESGLGTSVNGAATDDTVYPPYSNESVFECKYELDSIAAFLEVSTNYYEGTSDATFFSEYDWVDTVKLILNVTQELLIGTYAANGSVNASPYTFTRETTVGTETLSNSGRGNPVADGTGLVRSAFRPSDDACIYELFIPANMMFSRYLNSSAAIAAAIGESDLADQMTSFASSIKDAITTYGIVNNPKYGEIYLYETDGWASVNAMDDANIPSLLSAPFIGYLDVDDEVYQNTRAYVLSDANPYWARGPVISAVGGPHEGVGMAWPMASIIRIFTSDNDTEITTSLKEIVSSTDGLGLIHESINSFNQSDWTRQWFSWANGLFGQMILDLAERKPEILQQSFQ